MLGILPEIARLLMIERGKWDAVRRVQPCEDGTVIAPIVRVGGENRQGFRVLLLYPAHRLFAMHVFEPEKRILGLRRILLGAAALSRLYARSSGDDYDRHGEV